MFFMYLLSMASLLGVYSLGSFAMAMQVRINEKKGMKGEERFRVCKWIRF